MLYVEFCAFETGSESEAGRGSVEFVLEKQLTPPHSAPGVLVWLKHRPAAGQRSPLLLISLG